MKIDLSNKKKTTRTNDFKFSFDTKLPLIKKHSSKNKEEFYREFSILIKSGIDYNQALEILIDQQKSKAIKAIYRAILFDVVKGKTLYEALKSQNSFSPYEYYSIRIGEDTRRLPEVFDQLQMFYSRKIKMKRQVISILTYPAFVIFITFGVLYFMLNYVVPMFSTLFKQFGKELPSITQFVLDLSEKFNVILLIFLAVILLLWLGHKALNSKPYYQNLTSSILMRIPFFGELLKKIYIARFCQSFSLLLGAKTPLITAISLTEKMITFYPLKTALAEAKTDVIKGETFSDSLAKHSFFTPKIISLTFIGEQINELDKMYDNLAHQYNEDIDHSTKQIGTILEPLMILLIGSIVGFIMVAMYSPIFNLSKILER